MACVVAARVFSGPFAIFGLPVNVPLNPEGMFGIAVTLLLVTIPRGQTAARDIDNRPLAALTVAVLSLVAFLPALRLYFFSDDFALLRQVRYWSIANVIPSFTNPGGDGFFRPLGYLSLALDGAWAGTSPALWHLSAILLHTINAMLVVWLARRMQASALAAFFAGALFALHGGRPEAVVWIAARFDLLATLFILAALLLFDYERPWLALPAFVLALISKESAYVFPVVLVLYSLHIKRPVRRTIPFFVAAAVLFAYRLYLFRGIGGYVEGGEARVFSLKLATTLKAVFVRLWTGLYFPIDWTTEPAWWLADACVLAIAAALWLALRSRPSQPLWPMLAALGVAILPPLHLLSAGPDLAGARLVYLPSIFFCLLLAFAIDGLRGAPRIAVAASLLIFHLAALEHNIGSWTYASERIRTACAAAAVHNPVRVLDLPLRIRGAQAFNNGFPECVEMAAGHGVDVRRGPGDDDAAVLRWNPATDTLEPAGP